MSDSGGIDDARVFKFGKKYLRGFLSRCGGADREFMLQELLVLQQQHQQQQRSAAATQPGPVVKKYPGVGDAKSQPQQARQGIVSRSARRHGIKAGLFHSPPEKGGRGGSAVGTSSSPTSTRGQCSSAPATIDCNAAQEVVLPSRILSPAVLGQIVAHPESMGDEDALVSQPAEPSPRLIRRLWPSDGHDESRLEGTVAAASTRRKAVDETKSSTLTLGEDSIRASRRVSSAHLLDTLVEREKKNTKSARKYALRSSRRHDANLRRSTRISTHNTERGHQQSSTPSDESGSLDEEDIETDVEGETNDGTEASTSEEGEGENHGEETDDRDDTNEDDDDDDGSGGGSDRDSDGNEDEGSSVASDGKYVVKGRRRDSGITLRPRSERKSTRRRLRSQAGDSAANLARNRSAAVTQNTRKRGQASSHSNPSAGRKRGRRKRVSRAASSDRGKGSEPVYLVEEIRDHRVDTAGKVQFEVKWEGYASDENTWEPVGA